MEGLLIINPVSASVIANAKERGVQTFKKNPKLPFPRAKLERNNQKPPKMEFERKKKSMSTSPLYHSTLDNVVDEDNVVLITDELKVHAFTF